MTHADERIDGQGRADSSQDLFSSYVWRHVHIRLSRRFQLTDSTIQCRHRASHTVVPGTGPRRRIWRGLVVRQTLGYWPANPVQGADYSRRCVRRHFQRRGPCSLGVGKDLARHCLFGTERAGWCERLVLGDILGCYLGCVIYIVGNVLPRYHADTAFAPSWRCGSH